MIVRTTLRGVPYGSVVVSHVGEGPHRGDKVGMKVSWRRKYESNDVGDSTLVWLGGGWCR